MIDFHIEVSCLGKGLLPSEALTFASFSGFNSVGLVIKSDAISYKHELPLLINTIQQSLLYTELNVFPGVVFAHVPPGLLKDVVCSARELGAQLILAQGEGSFLGYSLSTAIGTNFAIINSGIDILTCPGLISSEDAAFATEKGISIELTGGYPCNLFNGHIVSMFSLFNFNLTISCGITKKSCFSSPEITRNFFQGIAFGAGLDKKSFDYIHCESRKTVQRLLLSTK